MKKIIIIIMTAVLLLAASCEEAVRYENVYLYDGDVLLQTIPVVFGSYAPYREALDKENMAFVRWEYSDGSAYDFATPVEAELKLYAAYEDICIVKGHTLVYHPAEAAKCLQDGHYSYYTCAKCDFTTFSDEIVLPALGHDIVHHEAREATCLAVGWDAYDACSRGDYTTYEEIPIGHNYSDGHVCKTCGYCEYFLVDEDGVLTLSSKEDLAGAIVIPEGVTALADSLFENCGDVTSVTLPSTLKTIGKKSFHLSGITSITLPSKLETIGERAFESTGITCITGNTLPASVRTIGDSVFHNCTELESIIIPDTVTSIGEGLFFYCESLVSVTLPSWLTSIPSAMFSYCSALETVDIPDNVTSIEKDAFFDCSSLSSVTLPDGLVSIGEWAFGNCHALSELNVPASVQSIGEKAFLHSKMRLTINNSEGDIEGAPWGADKACEIVYL